MYRHLLIILLLSFHLAFSQNIQKAELVYNQERFSAYLINNTSFLSKEDLSYIIGKPVSWDNKEKVVIIDNMRVYTKIVIYKGQLLVAIKEVLLPLGYQIKWNQSSRTITIIPPSNKDKEYKANVKIEKKEEDIIKTEKNTEKNSDGKKYEIPFIDSSKDRDSNQDRNRIGQGFQVVFIPRSAFNEEYKVTVSDLKEGKVYKGMYNAQAGYKFVIISVSQQNLSNKVQLYTGKFVLFDNRNVRYEYIEGLSSYILQILMPNGINFGTLVFEIPDTSIPSKLVLETYGSTPIIINLL